jgi:hypothetical protein
MHRSAMPTLFGEHLMPCLLAPDAFMSGFVASPRRAAPALRSTAIAFAALHCVPLRAARSSK